MPFIDPHKKFKAKRLATGTEFYQNGKILFVPYKMKKSKGLLSEIPPRVAKIVSRRTKDALTKRKKEHR